MPFLKVNHSHYYYEISGVGHPLILIAGYTRDHTAWLPILNNLSQHFKLCVIDNRGVGQTKDDGQVLTAEMMARDMIELAETLKLHRPHIVGQSMGGTIAQIMAGHYPDKISKLALIVTASKWRNAMLRGFAVPLQMRELNLDFDLIFSAIVPWIYGEKFLQDAANVEQVKTAILANPYPQSLDDQKRQYHVLTAFDGRENLKNIKAPTFIGYGKEDITASPQDSRDMAEHIAGAKLVAFDSAHGILLEAPEALTTELISFLS